MADTWIVSNHRFVQHKTLEKAETEAARLRAAHPKKDFRVYRVKSSLRASKSWEDLERAKQIIRDLIGLARINPGNLHQYGAALDDAQAFLDGKEPAPAEGEGVAA